ncbi:MAG: preprotein translocase subunit YajC [Alphaproteobacteria bacterium]|nr:preprotein translocase subunit YajC [Alphaproteobacteria bacterium]
MFISNAFAQSASDVAGASPILGTVLQIALIFVVFYLLLIRPQQKKMKQHEAALLAIKAGDNVITGGGIYATVIAVDGDDLTLEISKGVEVKAHRYTIREVLQKTEAPERKTKKNKKS